MSTPNSASKASQTRLLASDSSTLTGVENCDLMPPAALAVLPVPSDPCS